MTFPRTGKDEEDLEVLVETVRRPFGSLLNSSTYTYKDPGILLPGGNKRIYTYRALDTNIHRSFIGNSQNQETTQMSIDRWMDKQRTL